MGSGSSDSFVHGHTDGSGFIYGSFNGSGWQLVASGAFDQPDNQGPYLRIVGERGNLATGGVWFDEVIFWKDTERFTDQELQNLYHLAGVHGRPMNEYQVAYGTPINAGADLSVRGLATAASGADLTVHGHTSAPGTTARLFANGYAVVSGSSDLFLHGRAAASGNAPLGGYGHRDPRVWERQGQELVAYIDEADTSNVLLCEVGGRPLFYAANDGLIGTDAESIREAGKAQAKARKRARDRFKDIDLAVAPTADVAIGLKRKAAEQAAAQVEPADVPERSVTVIYTGFEEALKEAQRQELRATGTDDDGIPETTLKDLDFGNPVMEDHGDPWRDHGKRG